MLRRNKKHRLPVRGTDERNSAMATFDFFAPSAYPLRATQ